MNEMGRFDPTGQYASKDLEPTEEVIQVPVLTDEEVEELKVRWDAMMSKPSETSSWPGQIGFHKETTR